MDISEALGESPGFFTRAQAVDAGYSDQQIAAQVRSSAWIRFRRGYYAPGDMWRRLDEVARHRLRSRAVMHSLGPAVVLSHVSAAVELGLVTWGQRLDRVHVTRLDGGAGRVEGDVVHHEGLCLADDVHLLDGLPVMAPERAALEAGSKVSGDAALSVLDSVLHEGLADHDGLSRRFVQMRHWPHMRHLHVPVRMADAGADGPGESRGRWLFWKQGIPAPITQYAVHDTDGSLLGTCDWGWPQHELLGEFDGRLKYGRLVPEGQTPGDVVFAEKRREDRLRELTGFAMVRLVWSDLDRPRLTGDRIRQAMRVVG
ncbi:type IV toxin-antitoxin system AbiEi family antitoxin domain-containing protein [uncultured Nocardioides sp.]|uniref:type IV toxin-antitoxin system AbiEi family antitoxin domain-containing protein n=1 Tax=uncultured Nocardioides sp. TaxID=198441 RepID=UPI0025D1AC99|nr:type IV toxin-antitoxin system AbiEi family antitoxin domain-containing protein [uncultured Nocardioides sp.]